MNEGLGLIPSTVETRCGSIILLPQHSELEARLKNSGHTPLHSELEVSLTYIRPYLKENQIKTK